jgi:predicted ATP-grasp superfamily ATP-dependent carboligase
MANLKLQNDKHRIPVIILGGAENTLAIVRDFAKKGIETRVIAGRQCPAFDSRYTINKNVIPEGQASQEYFAKLLLDHFRKKWQGSVVFACSDDAIEFIIEHRQQLDDNYKLDIQKAPLQRALLDKKETLKLAKASGLNIPAYWDVDDLSDIETIANTAIFPVILKPLHSHVFQRTFQKKMLLISNAEELRLRAKEVLELEIKFMITEFIAGPDSRLSSFYTYLDHDRNALFRYTKFVLRRFPVNFGGGSFHGVKWLPETAQEGERFFRNIDFTGLANIEFKKDVRDGKLKVIECNARFTAAQELVTRCGINMPYIIYCYLTGTKIPEANSFKENLHYWYLNRDFNAFREMRQRGELTFLKWISSFAMKKLVFPVFRWDDPRPALKNIYEYMTRKFLSR